MPNFLQDAPLYRFSEVRKRKSLLPKERGIYALFFINSPGVAPKSGCYSRDNLHLLYVGTAGADLSKAGNLRNRLGDHHLGGNERRSTICQTLAALMPEVAGQCLEKLERGKVKFHTSAQGVTKIQEWLDVHVSACWMTHPDPGALEKVLIGEYDLPLNLEFNSHHPFASRLAELRAKRRSTALRVGQAVVG